MNEGRRTALRARLHRVVGELTPVPLPAAGAGLEVGGLVDRLDDERVSTLLQHDGRAYTVLLKRAALRLLQHFLPVQVGLAKVIERDGKLEILDVLVTVNVRDRIPGGVFRLGADERVVVDDEILERPGLPLALLLTCRHAVAGLRSESSLFRQLLLIHGFARRSARGHRNGRQHQPRANETLLVEVRVRTKW